MAELSIKCDLDPGEVAEFRDVIPYSGFINGYKINLETGIVIRQAYIDFKTAKLQLVINQLESNIERSGLRIPILAGCEVVIIAANHDTTTARSAEIVLSISGK